jgi:imidazolonepropionase
MKKGIIFKDASQIVTVSGFCAKKGKEMQEIGVIENKSLVTIGELIEEINTFDEISKKYNIEDFEIIDVKGKTITPGFVDSHTHVVFGGYRQDEFDWRLKGISYVEIMQKGGGISNSVIGTKEASFDELVQLGIKRIKSMVQNGVTTIESKSGYGLDKETELKQLRVLKKLGELTDVDIISTFLGPHSVPKEYKGKEFDFIKFIVDEVLPIVRDEKLVKFVDIFTEKNVFEIPQTEEYLTKSREMGFELKMHADEIFPLGGAQIAAKYGCISADHLLAASDEGLLAMRDNGVIATLLPVTAFSLKENYARARFMIDNGLAVALASDFNPGSCFSESIPLIIALSTLYMGMTSEEVISALTINGAAAIGMADTIGSLDPGKKADIIVHEFPSYKFLPYHIGVSTVQAVYKNGRNIYQRNF